MSAIKKKNIDVKERGEKGREREENGEEKEKKLEKLSAFAVERALIFHTAIAWFFGLFWSEQGGVVTLNQCSHVLRAAEARYHTVPVEYFA